ncbi:MAG: ATP-binding protein [Nitrospira sp.]|jgi:PAS domain S-box-containing protein|nr:ATP-binding protein [Nitrospira sp.]
MRERAARLFNNLPIHRKLLLASFIPLVALIVLSVMTYQSVETFSQDEEQLDSLYVTQKNAAEYMRLAVDLETGFRGYVLTEQHRYLRPYRVAQEGIAAIGHDLAERLSGEQLDRFKAIQTLVVQLVTEKEALIRAIKEGHKQEAFHYIEEGRGRELMVEIRRQMGIFDRYGQQSVAEKLAQLSQDRTSTMFVVLGGGVFTFGLMVSALYLIARSIATPLRDLATTVGSSPAGLVPAIAVLARTDEIGDLTRVMHDMSAQIRGHFNEMEKSEAALRRLNEHLAASEAKYRGLVDHAPFGIFTTTGMQITFSNRYNQELAGLDPDDPVDPDAFRECIHPEDRDRVLSEFRQAVAQGQPCETVFRFLHKNGGVRKVLSRRLPIVGGDGLQPVYVGFNVDITALEDLQARLSRAEHLATLGQVAAGIAHELRNPLVGIGSTASLLLDEFAGDDPRRTDIDVILKEAKRLDRIVNQIVEYARPRELAPVQFSLSDVIDEVVKTLDVPLQAKQLGIRASLSPTAAQVHADRDQIKQVLLNVIHNAIDASPVNGAAIEVIAFELSSQDRPGIVVLVKDAGVGIAPDALSRVFEPFFTTGKRHGTGLGLAICRNIIASHGGDIHMTSEAGKGTTVRIWLPLSQEPHTVKG